jgi:hypothetical protein
MFGLNDGMRYYVCQRYVRMNMGINGLYKLVSQEMDLPPLSGAVFIFFSKNRQQVKLLRWDTDGFTLYQKRLERGTFEIPYFNTGMTYMQTCLGFILGYFAIAFILLPVYYRLNLTTIYSYLKERLGQRSYKTGAAFFLVSKMTGAAVRFYVVCIILQRFVLDAVGIPFPVTVVVMVALIWLYTRRGGIKTLVWTDTFQTLCMFTALLLIIYNVIQQLGRSSSPCCGSATPCRWARMVSRTPSERNMKLAGTKAKP